MRVREGKRRRSHGNRRVGRDVVRRLSRGGSGFGFVQGSSRNRLYY